MVNCQAINIETTLTTKNRKHLNIQLILKWVTIQHVPPMIIDLEKTVAATV